MGETIRKCLKYIMFFLHEMYMMFMGIEKYHRSLDVNELKN